ncbi:hypothetical protein H4S08_004463 [Coemansia sp. RSA 1365]|nr:hypothetical protein H4S08_004463 [Coemansia sp. RSA 1365]
MEDGEPGDVKKELEGELTASETCGSAKCTRRLVTVLWHLLASWIMTGDDLGTFVSKFGLAGTGSIGNAGDRKFLDVVSVVANLWEEELK